MKLKVAILYREDYTKLSLPKSSPVITNNCPNTQVHLATLSASKPQTTNSEEKKKTAELFSMISMKRRVRFS